MSKLYLIPSPIGNLEDITLRAIETIRKVDQVLAEDTRKTGFLLKHLELTKPIRPYHKFNEHKSIEALTEQLHSGTTFGLITDAGTPGISDPGFLLVRECLKKGIPVETLPGPTAFVPALVNSGLPSERFVFEGFLPQKKGRQKRLKALVEEPRTMVFYESPHRLLKALEEFKSVFGSQRTMSVSRELTKIHEETIRGTIQEVIDYYSQHTIKGEIVLVVQGADG